MRETEPPPGWRKSSASGTSNCVEVAYRDDVVMVRDSTDVSGPVLRFSVDVWSSFTADLKGEVQAPDNG